MLTLLGSAVQDIAAALSHCRAATSSPLFRKDKLSNETSVRQTTLLVLKAQWEIVATYYRAPARLDCLR